MLVRSGKFGLFIAYVTLFFLAGCGGGGGGDSNLSSSIKSANPNIINSNPTVFTTGKNLALSYHGNVITIPNDGSLALTNNGTLPSNLLNYNVNIAPNYNLSSVAFVGLATDDNVNKRILNKKITGAIYLDNGLLKKIDAYTQQISTISAQLTQNGPGTFCGFWNSIIDFSTGINYAVYMTSTLCNSTPYQPNFYIVATNDTEATLPRQIDTPVAVLKDGWIVSKIPNPGSPKLEFYKCNFDCSTKTLISTVIDESDGSTVNSPFDGVQAYPFLNSDTLTNEEYALFFTSNSDIFLYVNSSGLLYKTSFPDKADLNQDMYSSRSSAIFEDENLFYLFCGPTSKVYGFTKNPNKLNNYADDKNNYYTVGYYPNSIVSFSQTSNYIYILSDFIGKTPGQQNYKGGVISIYKNGGNLSGFVNDISQNPIDSGSINSIFSDKFNNILYTEHVGESNGAYIKYYNFTGANNNISGSGYVSGYYSDGLTPQQTYTAGVIAGDDYSGYMANEIFVLATIDEADKNINFNELIKNKTDIGLGTVSINKSYDSIIPTVSFSNNIGGFSMINSTNSSIQPLFFGFDINSPNSLGCFYGC